MPKKKRDRTRQLFENTQKFKTTNAGHCHLAHEYEYRDVQNAPCITARSYQSLVRAVGYFKYNHEHHVLLRGQTRCFGKMLASLHRRTTVPGDADVETFLELYRRSLNVDQGPVKRLSTEALLQHYGIATRWLDVVDSVPHALFFATHDMVPSHKGGGLRTFVPSTEKYGLIYLFGLGQLKTVYRAKHPVVGFSRGDARLLVADLRKLKPALALRPHAQHGLLIKADDNIVDLWDRVVARIAVPTQEARRWIAARAFEPDELFPSTRWDPIFGGMLAPKMQKLLQDERAAGRDWGTIHQFDFHL